MAAVMGIDSSTQSVKVEVREIETGVLLGVGRAPHPPTTPPQSEQDPEAWWGALVRAVEEAGHQDRVVAISVAGQQHGMVALDAHGIAVHPGKLWNDTESAPQANALVGELAPELWARQCGSVPVAAFTVTKLRWLKDEHPESYARLHSVLLPHDYLTYRLTGRRVTDRGDASGTGYWSPTTNAWDLALLGLVDPTRDWSGVLPEVLAPFASVGRITAQAAQALRLSEEVLVGPGTGDNMGAALGLGLRAGDVVISLGTSGTVYAVSDTPTADPTGCVAGFADASGRFLPLVCTLNAMKVTDAVRRLLGTDHAEFDALALDSPAGAGGLSLVPYFDGERTPNRPEARGTLVGLRSDVSREQLARAAVEGVICGLLEGLDALTVAGVNTTGRLLLIGGGGKSAAFRQVLADLSQRPVTVPAAEEHVAIGAALQAAAVWRLAAGGSREPEEILDQLRSSWGLGAGDVVDPDVRADASAIRRAYALARG